MQRIDPKKNYFNIMPDEIVVAFANCLAPQDIQLLNQTNRILHKLTQDEQLWQRKLQQHFPHWKKPEKNWYQYFISVFANAYKHLKPSQRNLFSYAKEYDLQRIKEGFTNGKFFPADLACHEEAPTLFTCDLFHVLTRDTSILAYVLDLMSTNQIIIKSLSLDTSFTALSILHRSDLKIMSNTCRQEFYEQAIACGHIEIIQDLLKSDFSFLTGMAPLIVQAVYKQQLPLIRFLHETHQHSLDEVKASKVNALCAAAHTGNIDIIRYLLARGADTTKNLQDNNPLYVACQHGHLEAVKLLSRFYDINTENRHHKTPLCAAACEGYLEIVSYLLQQGATSKYYECQTPLYGAVKHGHLEVVKVLLSLANIKEAAEEGNTLLRVAALHDHLEIMQILLQNHAQVNLPFDIGLSAILIAAKNCRLESVKLLLKHNARILDPNGEVTYVPTTPEIKLLLTLKIQIEQAQLVLNTPLTTNSFFSSIKEGKEKLILLQKILDDLLQDRIAIEVENFQSIYPIIEKLMIDYESASKAPVASKFC